MKRGFFLLTVQLTMAVALVFSAVSGVPMLLSHQGRLLDASDQPVTGTRNITFHIFEVETGGVALWTEPHADVPIDEGLFHVTLGGSVTISGDLLVSSGTLESSRWLEIEVDGVALVPRLQLGSAPYSVASSRVSGDVETLPGAVFVRALQDPDKHTELVTLCNSDGTGLTMLDSNKTDHSSVRATWTTSNPGIGTVSGGAFKMVSDDDGDGFPEYKFSTQTGDLISGSFYDADSDDDGVVDHHSELLVNDQGAALELESTSSSSGARYRAGVRVINGTKAVTSVEQYSDIDEDGDGHSEAKTNIAALLNGSTVIGCATDADDDGVPEFSNELSSSPSGVSHNLVWNSALDLGSVPNKEVIFRITPTDGTSEITEDSDGDGIQEKNVGLYVSDVSGQAGVRSSYDSDDDGVPEAETELSTSSSGVVHKFAWNSAADLGAEPNLKWNINLNPTGNDVTGLMSSDVDGDGTPEMKYGTILAGLSQIAESRMETDTDDNGTPDVGISSKTTLDSAVLSSFFERGDKPTQSQFSNLLDSDGITSTFDSHNGSTTGTIRMMASPDSVDEISIISDGSSSSTSSMRLRLNELETKLQNIGILARTTVTQACDDTSASISIKRNDGPDTPIAMEIQDLTTSPLRVSHRLALDSDVDGIANKQILLDCDDDDAGLAILAGVAIPKFIDITARDAGALPGSTSDVSLVMGMGSDSLIELRGDETSTSVRFRSGTKYWKFSCEPLSSNLTATNSLGVVELDLNGDGRIGIDGAAHATNPIHHSSGAHLTVGGDWTNASDKDLKENFTKIDGEELLEKIEELPISQWNYKNEDESVVHIGPTAQDFKDAFGVGSNDKTISTIDPSGIALAAIKELNKQNQELAKQNKELQKELENLKRQVEDLVSKR